MRSSAMLMPLALLRMGEGLLRSQQGAACGLAGRWGGGGRPGKGGGDGTFASKSRRSQGLGFRVYRKPRSMPTALWVPARQAGRQALVMDV